MTFEGDVVDGQFVWLYTCEVCGQSQHVSEDQHVGLEPIVCEHQMADSQ